ncbi:MAG: hypothetical protein E7582_07615 [Ruminococcaceae bacterium]|nr:hypothetical protein [Oscillospiraceae bacterium]MBE6782355.1 hypothetical protein [Oscillospiraceae bacterium]
MTVFLSTLTPMATLFFCIALGFIISKTKALPDNASKTMAKMETWIFCPALNFMTMIRYCNFASLTTHAINIFMACISLTISLTLSIILSRFFVKKKTSERGIYNYALAFANSGYVGDPIILALFGEEALAYYKFFCLPLTILIYTWGISVLTPRNANNASPLKRILNPPTIALFAGIVVGLSGLGNYLPTFCVSALDSLKGCMGPVAMLLAGVTIARYNFLDMLKNKKVYIATGLRLVIIPTILVASLFAVKTLLLSLLNITIGNEVLFLCFFATATPLGLNTIVFPEAYGGNPETGASMAMISHTLCVISIPLMYALMVGIFGRPFNV